MKAQYLATVNATLSLLWFRVLYYSQLPMVVEEKTPLYQALVATAAIEIMHSMLRISKSPLLPILLFNTVRLGVEYWVASAAASYTCVPHTLMIMAWSLGDGIRFACFALLSAFDSDFPKHIRYNVGPLLFPVGAFAEAWLVVHVANQQQTKDVHRYLLYAAACLWPVGFYPLYTQLLRQRRKFYQSTKQTKKE